MSKFSASECSCEACVQNCRRPAHFLPNEIAAVAAKINIDYGTVVNSLTEFKLVAKLISDGETREIYGRTPRTSADGWCTFFNRETKRCGIHEVKPFGCKYADHNTTELEAKRLRDALGEAWTNEQS